MVGGVIWWVLSEIQSLELCNPPTTPFTVPTSSNMKCPKLGEHRNMAGGVIWLVLSEIQSLELCNTPSTSFTIRTWIVQFLRSIDLGSSSKLGQHSDMVGGVIWWVLTEIQSLELCYSPTTVCTVQTSYEVEVSHFLWPIDFGSSPKLGQQHNVVGGVIWCVLSEIQSLELWIHQPLHLRYQLRLNMKCPISLINGFGSSPKPGQHHHFGGRSIWWVLSEIQSLELCNPPTTSFTVRTSYELEVSNFVDQMISNWVLNLGNNITW